MDQQETENRPVPAADGYVTRPGVVTLICIASLIVLIMSALFEFPQVVYLYRIQNGDYLLLGVITLLSYGTVATIIFGLWRANNWARIAYVIVFPILAVLEALAAPSMTSILRLLVLPVLCILLYRPKASAYFRGETLPPIDVASGLDLGAREIIPCPSCGREIYSTLTTCHHCGYDLQQESGGERP